jgi:K(+)-stimulated pyrophosphate-energized sodium pump
VADAINWIIPIAGIAAVVFALYLARDVLARDTGTQAMQDVAGTIYEGAIAFIKRQYTTIAILAGLGAIVIGAVIAVVETEQVAETNIFGMDLGIRTGIAFLVGAICSMLSGIIGMYISVKSNVRTASAAQHSLVGAVQTAMRGGAVSGFLVVALSLLGVWGIFAAFGGLQGGEATKDAPFLIVGFGFGASFVALFAQLGGGHPRG